MTKKQIAANDPYHYDFLIGLSKNNIEVIINALRTAGSKAPNNGEFAVIHNIENYIERYYTNPEKFFPPTSNQQTQI